MEQSALPAVSMDHGRFLLVAEDVRRLFVHSKCLKAACRPLKFVAPCTWSRGYA